MEPVLETAGGGPLVPGGLRCRPIAGTILPPFTSVGEHHTIPRSVVPYEVQRLVRLGHLNTWSFPLRAGLGTNIPSPHAAHPCRRPAPTGPPLLSYLLAPRLAVAHP